MAVPSRTFSVIPATILQSVKFQPQGTSSRFELPSVVEMETPVRFDRHLESEIALSVVEATGTFSVGNEHFFTLGAIRKSVLDKLVGQFDIRSDRRTMPPTNFEDFFVAGGLFGYAVATPVAGKPHSLRQCVILSMARKNGRGSWPPGVI